MSNQLSAQINVEINQNDQLEAEITRRLAEKGASLADVMDAATSKVHELYKAQVREILAETIDMEVRDEDINFDISEFGDDVHLSGELKYNSKDEFGMNSSVEADGTKLESFKYDVAVDPKNNSFQLMSGQAETKTKIDIKMLSPGVANVKVHSPSDEILMNLVTKGDILLAKEGPAAGMQIADAHNSCLVVSASTINKNEAVIAMLDTIPKDVVSYEQMAKVDVEETYAEEVDMNVEVKSPAPDGP